MLQSLADEYGSPAPDVPEELSTLIHAEGSRRTNLAMQIGWVSWVIGNSSCAETPTAVHSTFK